MQNLDHNENLLIQAIRESIKTKEDQAFLTQLETIEGASLEWFEFGSLLSIYKALLTGNTTLN